jgi:GAF domain-containing protein
MDPATIVRMFWQTRLAEVVTAGEPSFVEDMLNGTPVEIAVTEPMRRAGIGALALLPLRVDGRVIGAMGIRFFGTREFDESERAFLSSFSSQVAVALRNAQYLTDLQDRAERLDRLASERELEQQRAEAAADVARTALAHGGLLAGAQALLGILERVVPTSGKAIGVARARDGRLEYVGAHGSLALLLGHRPAGLRGVLGIAPDGLPVELASLRNEAPEQLRSVIPDERALVLPLVARDRALGVLLVSATPDAMWTSTQRETL